MSEKYRGSKKKEKAAKKYRGTRQRCRQAANSRSAPGGRHPSYATDSDLYYPRFLWSKLSTPNLYEIQSDLYYSHL